MEAIFFGSTAERATRIRSADDLDDECAVEPLIVSSPRVFAYLAEAAGVGTAIALAPLRDATCQSFPVWSLERALARKIVAFSEGELDQVIERWLDDLGSETIDADPFELSMWLVEIQAALRESEEGAAQLFVLFEEKAMPY